MVKTDWTAPVQRTDKECSKKQLYSKSTDVNDKEKHGLFQSCAGFALIHHCEPGMVTLPLWPLVSASGEEKDHLPSDVAYDGIVG